MSLGTSETVVLGALGASAVVLVVVGLFELRSMYRSWRAGYGHWHQHLSRGMTAVRPEQWGRRYRQQLPRAPRRAHWPVRNDSDSTYEGEQV